ncbi:MAG TPA: hypothetical protein ENI77_12630 [Nitrospirae bacterium]|nr:hypothetical protein [Nitrospirota bacterium]
MPTAESNDRQDRSKIFIQIKILLAARLAIISFFMGTVVFYGVKYNYSGGVIPAMEPIGAAYLLTIFYALLFKFIPNPLRFAYLQLTVDLFLVTWIIYYTGGLNSPFSFLYILIIIAAAYFRSVYAPYLLATASSLLYSGLLVLEYLGVFEPYYAFPPLSDPGNLYYVFLTGVIHITIFYFIAFLSGHFTQLLSKSDKRLIQKSQDFTMLQAFHENVLANMGLGFLAIDLDGIILSHNLASERILRLRHEDIVRKPAVRILGLPRLAVFFKSIEKITTPFGQFDWAYTSPGRDKIQISMNVSKFVASGSTHGVIAVFQDVTNLKKLERQVADSERMAAIGRVSAAIAHEIRNPLASLSGSIQMLSSDLAPILDSESAKLMDIIMRETKRLNNIINKFLGYASPPALNTTQTNISLLLSETLTLLKSTPEYADKINFESDFSTDLSACVDQELIRQVIWNLCVNAIDAIDGEGSICVKAYTDEIAAYTIDARAGLFADDNRFTDCVCVKVSDTGKGIEKQDMNKIFEPFYTTKSYGTGLGLPTVHKIVKIHGGKIEVRSDPGKTTTFSVWLPIQRISASDAQAGATGRGF